MSAATDGRPITVMDGGGDSTDTLLRRVAVGDRDAFAALYDRLSPAVFGIALQRPTTVAPEARTQAVFVRLWRLAPGFPAQQAATAEAWIVAVVDDSIGAPRTPGSRRDAVVDPGSADPQSE